MASLKPNEKMGVHSRQGIVFEQGHAHAAMEFFLGNGGDGRARGGHEAHPVQLVCLPGLIHMLEHHGVHGGHADHVAGAVLLDAFEHPHGVELPEQQHRGAGAQGDERGGEQAEGVGKRQGANGHVPGTEPPCLYQGLGGSDFHVVGGHHAFGQRRRTRGVDDDGDTVRLAARPVFAAGRARLAQARTAFEQFIQKAVRRVDGIPAPGIEHGLPAVVVVNDERRVRFFDDVGDFVVAEVGVDGKQRAAGPQDTQVGRVVVGGIAGDDADAAA
ncbi:MAG: hypothetical protein QHC66_03915 [Pusillimonas sp.]|nr:hypothetical protein [Pusillimonas sp.]MDX3893849.1 hypothetical protein [Pusillimonas sp.]